MTDRDLIIEALRAYEREVRPKRDSARITRDRDGTQAKWDGRLDDALRIRAELEDNSDYVVRGGTQTESYAARVCAAEHESRRFFCQRPVGHAGPHNDDGRAPGEAPALTVHWEKTAA